jgi:hypothetical protein
MYLAAPGEPFDLTQASTLIALAGSRIVGEHVQGHLGGNLWQALH